jgi:hypothetical protein
LALILLLHPLRLFDHKGRASTNFSRSLSALIQQRH